MHADDLHRPLYCADILINALNQDPTRPLLHLLDGPTLTVGEHPAVSQSAVIGVPHPKWGEAIKALVVLRPGQNVTAEELIARVAHRKGSFQAPKTVEFIDSIPQTPVGKPDKKALRARFAERVGELR
jgi:acyl-CoA synthetase (AMP-forming)/AMP-acid ligase II